MNTKPLEKFARTSRSQLHEQVMARLQQVLKTDSPELRAKASVVAELNKQIAASSRQAVVERVAYTWFNRFCALRFMDANRYTRVGVVSPAAGHTQPEILQEAKAGHIDEELGKYVDRQRVFDLLSGRLPSPDGQAEAYRLLLVASCNQYHAVMPFLFEKIDDYTELLMPADLLSAGSVLAGVRDALTADACQDVEVIGWLYQFYISEKKDEVIGAKKPISPANIPAATQLFTPDWIVRYLVQNSLGRLWLLNHPHSRLAQQMEFYISDQFSEATVQSANSPTEYRTLKTEYLQVNSPEELTICDPAVGSGHMLTYAFDLLYAIYEEEGYNPPDIPRLILEKNLVGLEIDERAAALAAFALMMKARAKDRRFFRREVAPQITVLRPLVFTEAELDAEVESLFGLISREAPPPVIPNPATPPVIPNPATSPVIPNPATPTVIPNPDTPSVIPNPDRGEESSRVLKGEDSSPAARNDTLYGQMALLGGMEVDVREALRHDLKLFREADNFGALLRPLLSAAQLTRLHGHLTTATPTGQLQLFDQERRKKVQQAIAQAIPLAKQYEVVIANPPYMGSKNQNPTLKKFMNSGYKDVKADLFSAFTVRVMELTQTGGFIGLMTPFTWMFLSSYEMLRDIILNETTLTSLVRPEYHAFFESAYVPICAFTLQKVAIPDYKGAFIDLQDFYGADVQPVKALEAIQDPDCGYFYRTAATDFKNIPGFPIAYWVSKNVRQVFRKGDLLGELVDSVQGLATGNTDKFIRYWYEVSINNIDKQAKPNKPFYLKWYPIAKGGDFRKWYGNTDQIVNWQNNGQEIRNYYGNNGRLRSRPQNIERYLLPMVVCSAITSGKNSYRILQAGYIFDVNYRSLASEKIDLIWLVAFLNSIISTNLMAMLNPSMATNIGDIERLPILGINEEPIINSSNELIAHAKYDWDSFETSLDFSVMPLLHNRQSGAGLDDIISILRQQWQTRTLEMQRLEEENNRVFIEAYSLQSDLFPNVPLDEITLTTNPHYRYKGNKTKAELEALLLDDTMRELISYAVGCMFGRYSLDKPGLILANQGETVADYARQVFSEQYSVISDPLKTENWLQNTATFPPDADNAIPMLDGDWFSDDITERFKKFLRVTFGEEHYADNLAFIEAALGRDIRSYFLRDFYDHHVRMYKKRPIYWLFSSAKGSFNVLIYMHRYRPDTVSVVLNDYLREFRAKLTARKGHLQSVSISAATSPRDKTRALKDIADIDKTLKEIREYEDEILYPLATRQVAIDLDDGVAVNYNKLGGALKKVTGLSG